MHSCKNSVVEAYICGEKCWTGWVYSLIMCWIRHLVLVKQWFLQLMAVCGAGDHDSCGIWRG